MTPCNLLIWDIDLESFIGLVMLNQQTAAGKYFPGQKSGGEDQNLLLTFFLEPYPNKDE